LAFLGKKKKKKRPQIAVPSYDTQTLNINYHMLSSYQVLGSEFIPLYTLAHFILMQPCNT